MKVLVIPDTHLKSEIFDEAESILLDSKEIEKAVFIGDLVDEWNRQLNLERYEKIFERALKFIRQFPETLWCWGNHDISYIWELRESGYSEFAADLVRRGFGKLERALAKTRNGFKFIHRIDNTLFMHGGLSASWVYRTAISHSWPGSLLKDENIDQLLDEINKLGPNDMWDGDGSPIWLRPQFGRVQLWGPEKYKQVVGHTPVITVYETPNGCISTDTFSIMPDGKHIGDKSFALIDTVAGTGVKLKPK